MACSLFDLNTNEHFWHNFRKHTYCCFKYPSEVDRWAEKTYSVSGLGFPFSRTITRKILWKVYDANALESGLGTFQFHSVFILFLRHYTISFCDILFSPRMNFSTKNAFFVVNHFWIYKTNINLLILYKLTT